jgi:hypothetical protein
MDGFGPGVGEAYGLAFQAAEGATALTLLDPCWLPGLWLRETSAIIVMSVMGR